MIIWYRNSFLASLISIVACVFAVCGVYAAVDGEISGLLLLIPGIGGVLLGRWISDRKAKKTAFKSWYAERSADCDDLVRSSDAYATKLYRAMPTAQMLDYVRSLNPAAAAAIEGKSAPAAAPTVTAEPVYHNAPTSPPAAGHQSGSKLSGDLWTSSPDL